ncbi:MAG: adenosylcobinamide-phosphate synthase CbiB, partial [Muribaculaceae bacterium]|nr:adenosylcobinamide-phosphate synthase CbiB [Muribaculaceae bacterium]
VFICVWWILHLLSSWPWIKIIVETVGVFYCLAGTTLSGEVRMVFEACEKGLEAGRRQVGRIVGRDTASLSEQEIKTAALETLAENLSDGVIAPMFWYLLLGLPGMMAYKMVNTLDSMIGYKNERYLDFGRVAAKMDDVANYIPARLTAFLMVLSSGRLKLIAFVRRFGRSHASPNSGYPEAALAGILDCRFGGTHDYFGESVYKPYIGINPRELTIDDMRTSLHIVLRAELMMLLLVLLLRFLI